MTADPLISIQYDIHLPTPNLDSKHLGSFLGRVELAFSNEYRHLIELPGQPLGHSCHSEITWQIPSPRGHKLGLFRLSAVD
jgi:hypothetical protein